jgi:NAD(P)-dependent dehydrogenase (short-subunit alcohol dehydrogenase family)
MLVDFSMSDDPKETFKKPPHNEKPQGIPAVEGEMNEKPDFGEESYVGNGKLEGKIALVTGGDSGIGRAVSLAFAREGADVAIGYWNEHEDAEETKRVVEDSGKSALLLPGDLSSEDVCRNLIADTVNRFGRIDVLVNNAAYQGKAVEKFEDYDSERIRKCFEVNIIAMFHLVKYALPHLKPGSVIINVASIQAYKPNPIYLDYAATKGAIVTFTKGLAQELIGRGIRVNCVAPGPVWTPLIPQALSGEKLEKFGEQAPMKRPGQPVELAPAFVFLASTDSRFVVGETLGVTGGVPMP